MSKEKQVTIKLDIRSAAAVRQVLFEAQKGYGLEHTPERVIDIRKVISEIDSKIEAVISE